MIFLTNHERNEVLIEFTKNSDLILFHEEMGSPQQLSSVDLIFGDVNGEEAIVGIKYKVKGLEDLIPEVELNFPDMMIGFCFVTDQKNENVLGFRIYKPEGVYLISTLKCLSGVMDGMLR